MHTRVRTHEDLLFVGPKCIHTYVDDNRPSTDYFFSFFPPVSSRSYSNGEPTIAKIDGTATHTFDNGEKPGIQESPFSREGETTRNPNFSE